MGLTVHLTDVMAQYDPSRNDDGCSTKRISVSSDTSIADIGKILGLVTFSIEYEQYYRVTDPNFLEGFVPFLIVGNRVRWMQPIQETTIGDFFATNDIRSNDLHIRHGWPAAGGFGPADILALWDQVYAFLQYISPILTPVGFIGGIAGVIIRLRGVRESPGWVFSLVASRPRWNPVDLAELTAWPPERAKDLLDVCCYEYDPHTHMFAKTPASEEFFS